MVPNRGAVRSFVVVAFVSICSLALVAAIPVGYVAASETGTVEGIVIDEDWMPVDGANVTIAEYNTTTKTDENGEFELEIPLVGQAFEELEISALGYETKTTTVRGHSNDTKRFWLDDRNGSIEGTVTDGDGEPASGISVEIREEEGEVVNETTTGADGTFRFETQEGIYTLVGSLEDYEEARKTTTVTAAGSTANLTISPLPGTVSGTVSSDDDSPVQNATVTLEDDTTNVSTDENGSYQLDLDEGRHTLVAMAEDFENASQPIVIRPNVSETIDFDLEKVESDNDSISEPDGDIEVNDEDYAANGTDDDISGREATIEDDIVPADGSPFPSEVVVGTFTAIGIFVGTLLLLVAVAGVRSVTFDSR